MESLFSFLPVTCHTDFVCKGSTFVAIKGNKLNGNDFIPLAIKKGANKIVIQKNNNLSKDILDLIISNNLELQQVDDCRLALAQLSAKAWNYPNKKLKIIGVTGTKGKTSSTFLLHHIFNFAGYKTAMLSGVYNIINDKKYKSQLTTALPDYLYAFLSKCVEEGVEYVVMESAAQAFTLKRLVGLEFSGVIFTNLDFEHMEFYSSMEEYFDAKKDIFKQLKKEASVLVNIDNVWGNKIASQNKKFFTLSFDRKKNADFFVEVKKNNLTGIEIRITYQEKNYIFHSNLIGIFNAYNVAGIVSLCLKFNIEESIISKGLKSFKSIPGRMEIYSLKNGSLAIIDHAHNPLSFSSVLPILKSISKKLIVVFGAGGDRDKQRRPMMGDIASTVADKVIITSDNPRSENIEDIIKQIIGGVSEKNLKKVICESDRTKAIKKAYELSNKDDVIAILGKGADEYEIIGLEKKFFSDKEVILSCK